MANKIIGWFIISQIMPVFLAILIHLNGAIYFEGYCDGLIIDGVVLIVIGIYHIGAGLINGEITLFK